MTPLPSDRQLLLLAILVFGSLVAIVTAILRLMIFGRPRGSSVDRHRSAARPPRASGK